MANNLDDIRKVQVAPIKGAMTAANLTANDTWTKLAATMGGKSVWLWPAKREVEVIVLADSASSYAGVKAGVVYNSILPLYIESGLALWVKVPSTGDGTATVTVW